MRIYIVKHHPFYLILFALWMIFGLNLGGMWDWQRESWLSPFAPND